MDEHVVFATIAGLGLSALVLVPVALRRRRQRRDERALEQNRARGLHVPASLHPVIDTDRCIGSLSCLKACPEGDILGIIDGAARLVHATNCVGHGRCAAACPVGAITLVFGTATRGVDLPEVDGRFESSRPGVHLVGELAGMGLIQNAIEQGAQCAGYLAEALPVEPARGAPQGEVVVVGAGPAGVSCALALRAHGVPVRLLDRERLGGALSNYPRQGLVMAGPLALPGVAPLRQPRVGKQELLAWLGQALAGSRLPVEEGVTVTGLAGEDGAFTVQTDAGPIPASKVVLATGRGGSPRRLGVPGEQLPKVTHALVDADQYRGARVQVVGGGDAAVEAACLLAEQGGGAVTLAHRGPALSRCRPENQARALGLAGQGRLEIRPSTEVTAIEAQQVALRSGAGAESLANDYVIACLGGEASLGFLARMGVSLRRSTREAGDQATSTGRGAPTLTAEERGRRRFRRWLVGAGGVILAFMAGLWWEGRGYYPLGPGARPGSPLHLTLKPAGSLGLTIGIAATAVMLTNFLYALRKRWSALAGVGHLGSWLDLHVFVGVMSPLVIAFHAAFRSENLFATATWLALAVVVATGLVGRYLYDLVPRTAGPSIELADLLGQLERLKARVRPLLAGARDPAPLEGLFAEASAPPSPAPLLAQLAHTAVDVVPFRLRLAAGLRLLPPAERAGVRDGLLRLRQVRAQAGLFGGIRRLMRAWRTLHVALAILAVLALLAHIGVAVYLGYVPRLR